MKINWILNYSGSMTIYNENNELNLLCGGAAWEYVALVRCSASFLRGTCNLQHATWGRFEATVPSIAAVLPCCTWNMLRSCKQLPDSTRRVQGVHVLARPKDWAGEEGGWGGGGWRVGYGVIWSPAAILLQLFAVAFAAVWPLPLPFVFVCCLLSFRLLSASVLERDRGGGEAEEIVE